VLSFPGFTAPVFVPRVVYGPTSDGISTPYTITVRHTKVVPGTPPTETVTRGRGTLKLPKPPTPGLNARPSDDYEFVDTIQDAVQMMNKALDDAFQAAIIAGAPLQPDEAPYFSWIRSPPPDRIRLTAYPFQTFRTRHPSEPSTTRVEIFVNREAAFLLSAFSYETITPFDARNPDPNGEDVLLRIYNDGTNWEGGGGSGPRTGPDPPNPANAKIFTESTGPLAFPGVERIVLTTSMPIVGEKVGDGLTTLLVLTDFTPDRTTTEGDGGPLIYNAGFGGNVRWHSLEKNPIRDVSLNIDMLLDDGRQVPFIIRWAGSEPSIKLAFAPKAYARDVAL